MLHSMPVCSHLLSNSLCLLTLIYVCICSGIEIISCPAPRDVCPSLISFSGEVRKTLCWHYLMSLSCKMSTKLYNQHEEQNSWNACCRNPVTHSFTSICLRFSKGTLFPSLWEFYTTSPFSVCIRTCSVWRATRRARPQQPSYILLYDQSTSALINWE